MRPPIIAWNGVRAVCLAGAAAVAVACGQSDSVKAAPLSDSARVSQVENNPNIPATQKAVAATQIEKMKSSHPPEMR